MFPCVISFSPDGISVTMESLSARINLVSLWNDLVNVVFDGVELAGFKSRDNASLLALAVSLHFYFQLFSLSLLSFYL